MAAIGALGFAPLQPLQDPPRWRADIRIVDMTVQRRPRGLEIRIRVTSDFDDDALNAVVEVLLPVGVGVLSLDPSCRPSPSPVRTAAARVTCELGDLRVRSVREVNLLTTLPAAGGDPNHSAAFVRSDTPDPNPSNNFAQRLVP